MIDLFWFGLIIVLILWAWAWRDVQMAKIKLEVAKVENKQDSRDESKDNG